LYYSDRNGWTPDVKKAKNFRMRESAFNHGVKQEIGHLEVVMLEGDDVEEVVVPIQMKSEGPCGRPPIK
jgi:hypothetical protein